MMSRKTVADIIRSMLKANGIRLQEFAESIGTTAQNFNGRLNNNAFTAEEVRDYAEKLGFKIVVIEKKTGFDAETFGESEVHIRRKLNSVVFDTNNAVKLCTAELAFGLSAELYKDANGYRMFVLSDNQPLAIKELDEGPASRFYAAYAKGEFDPKPFQFEEE